MSAIEIHMLPASEGDAFFVTCTGNAGNRVNILIDAGISDTYDKYLKKFLIDNEIDKVDLLIVTHIDNDHIGGAIRLFEENGSNSDSRILEIKEVWHNTYRHLQFNKQTKVDIGKEMNYKVLKDLMPNKNGGFTTGDINAEDGSMLGKMLLKGKYNWNGAVGGKAICVENIPDSYSIGENIDVTILSPTTSTLSELSDYWFKELVRQGFAGKIEHDEIFDDAMEFLLLERSDEDQEDQDVDSARDIASAAPKTWEDARTSSLKNTGEDSSSRNASSIAFILKCDDLQVLFLGDSRASVIEESLKMRGFLQTLPFNFDAIKISHHGSKKNNTMSLFRAIDAPVYLISTNGAKHHHPHPETLVRIVERDNSEHRNIVCNYSTEYTRFLEHGKEKGYQFSFEFKNYLKIEKREDVHETN